MTPSLVDVFGSRAVRFNERNWKLLSSSDILLAMTKSVRAGRKLLVLSVVVSTLIFVLLVMTKRSKSGGASSVRVKISRPSAIEAQLSQVTRSSVTLHHGADGRLRQSTSFIPTGETIPVLQHIDDVLNLPVDTSEDSSTSGEVKVDEEEPTKSPVCLYFFFGASKLIKFCRHTLSKTGSPIV